MSKQSSTAGGSASSSDRGQTEGRGHAAPTKQGDLLGTKCWDHAPSADWGKGQLSPVPNSGLPEGGTCCLLKVSTLRVSPKGRSKTGAQPSDGCCCAHCQTSPPRWMSPTRGPKQFCPTYHRASSRNHPPCQELPIRLKVGTPSSHPLGSRRPSTCTCLILRLPNPRPAASFPFLCPKAPVPTISLLFPGSHFILG